jgi:hypothetical protein
MNLLRLTGFAQAPTREKVGDKGMAALVAAAEQMLRAGVVLTTDFWSGCEDYEREALALAGDRLAADRATLMGIASQGPRGAALLTAHRDGGAALEAVEDAAERARNAQANDSTTKQLFGHEEVATDSVLTRLPTTVSK